MTYGKKYAQGLIDDFLIHHSTAYAGFLHSLVGVV
jgi:hypothetical protein